MREFERKVTMSTSRGDHAPCRGECGKYVMNASGFCMSCRFKRCACGMASFDFTKKTMCLACEKHKERAVRLENNPGTRGKRIAL